MEIKSPLSIDEISTILPNTTTADSSQGCNGHIHIFRNRATQLFESNAL